MLGIPRGTSVLFSRGTRARLGLAMVGSIAAAGLEIIGVAAVVPLMQLLTGTVPDEGALGALSSLFGDPPASQLARYIAAIVFVAFVAKAVFTIVFRWWLLRLPCRARGTDGDLPPSPVPRRALLVSPAPQQHRPSCER